MDNIAKILLSHRWKNNLGEQSGWVAKAHISMVRSNTDLHCNPDSHFISHTKTKCKVLSLITNYIYVYVNLPHPLYAYTHPPLKSVSENVANNSVQSLLQKRREKYIWMEWCKGYCSTVEHILSCRNFPFSSKGWGEKQSEILESWSLSVNTRSS